MQFPLSIILLCLASTPQILGQVFQNPYPTTLRTATATAAPETIQGTIFWFHTNTIATNAPAPTLKARINSVDQFGFTKYIVTCNSKDAAAGCTYTDFMISVSGTSQMYYESGGSKKSVGCELQGTTAAVCSSRDHGQDITQEVTKTYNAPNFPGFYPVVVTAEPARQQLTFEQDVFIHERLEPEPKKASAPGRNLDPIFILATSLLSLLIVSIL